MVKFITKIIIELLQSLTGNSGQEFLVFLSSQVFALDFTKLLFFILMLVMLADWFLYFLCIRFANAVQKFGSGLSSQVFLQKNLRG